MACRLVNLTMKMVLLAFVSCTCYSLVASQFYSCPPVEEETAGVCPEDCSSDSDCQDSQELLKCCSNGCGHTCTRPSVTPYHAPPYNCPTPSDDVVGICEEECSNSTACDSGNLCCYNGCGHTCMSVCPLIRTAVSNQTLVGVYVPQCEDTGYFSSVQCHGSTGFCWCVDELTGEPTSPQIRGQPHCSCTYDGEERGVGETFTAQDQYNTCTCTVENGLQCTNNIRQQPVDVFYSCPAIRENEEAGICVTECKNDSECSSDLKCCYTGCGYSCMTPDTIPYVPLPSLEACPDSRDVPCALVGGSCTQNSFSCDEEKSMCCDNDCSSAVCISKVGPAPCEAAQGIARGNNSIGKFIPRCDKHDHFRGIQCHEHYCWCVDVQTGKPQTDYVAFESLQSLPCSECIYGAHKYSYLETFPSEDGCNTCSCIGGVAACTQVYCDGKGGDVLWDSWHIILVGCIVAVILLALIVVAMIVVVVIVRKNDFRHKRLKEVTAVRFESDMDSVYFRDGQEPNTVELKVPVEDVENQVEPTKA